MHNFKKHKASQKSTAKRRHTDAGEHALSILIAKNEMDSLSTFSDNRPPHRSPELQTAYDSNPHAGIFKRIFRSKSLKKNTNVILSSRSNSTILKDSLPLLRSDSNNYVSVQDSIIYLVFQNSIREVSLPSVLTFDWITSSFKSTFNMNFSTDFESSFNFNIKHSNADSFSPLVELNQICHKSIISLCIKKDFSFPPNSNAGTTILSSTPAIELSGSQRKFDISTTPSTIGLHSSHPDQLSWILIKEKVPLIIHDLFGIRRELHSLKVMNLKFQADYLHSIQSTHNCILSEIYNALENTSFPTFNSIPDFRIERQKIHSKESNYFNQSLDIYTELELLDLSIENLRLDTHRGCRIIHGEIELLSKFVNDIGTNLMNLRNQFLELEPKLRNIMSLELEVIVNEEKFVNTEGLRLEESLFKCQHMNNILIDLRKLNNTQSFKELNVIEITVDPFDNSNMREALLNEIRNTKIDHAARVKSIEMSRKLYFRKKEFIYDPMKAFTKDLQVQRTFLRKTNNLSVITNRNNVNYHKLLEDYKREKFIRRSNRKLIPNSNPSFISNIDNVGFTSTGLSPNVMSSVTNRKQNLLDTYNSSSTNETRHQITHFPETSDKYFKQKPLNTPLYQGIIGQNSSSSHSHSSFLPLVPGPTNISFSSYEYFTRPQEIPVTHIGSNESSSIQQFSVV